MPTPLQELQAQLKQVRAVVASNISWDDKYDLIFNPRCSRKVFAAFRELNLRFEYYDPDSDYEDDVRAFANAFEERMTALEPYFGTRPTF